MNEAVEVWCVDSALLYPSHPYTLSYSYTMYTPSLLRSFPLLHMLIPTPIYAHSHLYLFRVFPLLPIPTLGFSLTMYPLTIFTPLIMAS